MATPYLNGYLVKPAAVNSEGQVMFTDGTNIITPNQQQCEAYGYTYNEATGTCNAFNFTNNLARTLNNENNIIKGGNNVSETGTNNSFVIGENNTVKGISRNNIIIGTSNEIANGVDNANVYGTLAQATADNSIVLGGNEAADVLGERQNITLMYGKQTTDNSTVDAYLNNTTNSYFVVPTNAVIYFQSETLAVRIGGDSVSGAVGDFKAWVERGVVKNAAGTLSIDRSRTSPASSGTTTGWSPINNVSATRFRQTVKGATGMTLEWVSTIRITQIQTSVTLS
jgi:hypothetical protein